MRAKICTAVAKKRLLMVGKYEGKWGSNIAPESVLMLIMSAFRLVRYLEKHDQLMLAPRRSLQ
jgi:hypothetical protein